MWKPPNERSLSFGSADSWKSNFEQIKWLKIKQQQQEQVQQEEEQQQSVPVFVVCFILLMFSIFDFVMFAHQPEHSDALTEHPENTKPTFDKKNSQ